ncbi:MBL fold metallo-hydrolase [Aureimonas sp. SA4125]|uniref:quinoprotein relay system zinc metallohydrolase 2 n=1 Tax=Aureimonas sp. SA4125 TaxID=2826993 RepID=UPI001CC42EA8|nr:quinoprotein relay system zinc metallohydrolase 2 [Aureimonas sp. SA4125]BDA86334.1 MBL fold metallo-hydrolase [Aureimonas sp. SA4125]
MMSRRSLLQLGLVMASGAAKAANADAEGPLETGRFRAIADGVYVRLGRVALISQGNLGAIANLGFVVGKDAVAMIDSGGSMEDGRAALAAIRAVTSLPVRYLVNTHMHPDHIFGNEVFRQAGAEIIAHHALPAALAARRETYLTTMRDELGARLTAEVTIALPDSTVDGERLLDLGGRQLRLTAWGTAHTDNDLTVLDETSGTLFAGDLVFLDHVPIVDGSLKGWIAQLDALAALPAERVVPGHGPVAASWPQALQPGRRYLETLAGDIRLAIAEGRTLSEAIATAGASEAGNWALFDDYNARNASAAFAELEWE